MGVEINSAFWEQIKSNIIQQEQNPSQLTWVSSVSYIATEGDQECPKMVLGVRNQFFQYYIQESYLDKFYLEAQKLNHNKPIVIDLRILPKDETATSEAQKSFEEPATPAYREPVQQVKPLTMMNLGPGRPNEQLNPDLTFKSFVVGRNNEFAHAACYNIAQNPGTGNYNPLFISGPVGMGKTHLLQAVGNEISAAFPHLRILYFSAERFLNECISHIQRKSMESFRQKYRESADVILVDDVQMLGRGEAVQGEFFHILNAFIEQKKQIVLASDRLPKDIMGLEDRSRSRMEYGVIADIKMPDLETRIAILRYKAEKESLRLTEEVITHIARISKRSIRQLEGNLKKIKLYSELQGLPIDMDLVKRIIQHEESQGTISVEDIQKLVADHFQVRLQDLKSSTRSKQIVVPRQTAMYLIKKNLERSLVDIGRAFGGKDHTTVMNALERIEILTQKDLDLKSSIEELQTKIHNITGL